MRAITVALAGVAMCAAVSAQQRPSVKARSGDVVVVDEDDRVVVIRRREAQVLAVHDPNTKLLTVMLDFAGSSGKPDGGVDLLYRYQDVTDWHLGQRWKGPATAELYMLLGELGSVGLGLRTTQELIQFTGGAAADLAHDPSARQVPTRGVSYVPQQNESFALTEQRLADNARAAAEWRQKGFTVPSPNDWTAMTPPQTRLPETEPARVGSGLKTPAKLAHVDPVLPPAAAQAGVRGIVVVELTVDRAGNVSDAKVLRSIPMLDEAALTTVRQWKYAPTIFNGEPVPVIITAVVSFQ